MNGTNLSTKEDNRRDKEGKSVNQLEKQQNSSSTLYWSIITLKLNGIYSSFKNMK